MKATAVACGCSLPIFLLLLLVSITTVAASGESYTQPKVADVQVVSQQRGLIDPTTFNDCSSLTPAEYLAVGDTLTFTVNASDPSGSPLEFKWPGTDTWTPSTTHNYSVTVDDMKTHQTLWLFVRNNDSLFLEGESMGDVQYQFARLCVSDGRLGAKFIALNVELANGTRVQNPWNIQLPVGITIHVVAEAADPKGLPLEYRFELYRNCGGGVALQDWSTSNTVEYTLSGDDVTSCTGVWAFVRNNDGWDHEGQGDAYGDGQMSVTLKVSDGTMPPAILSVTAVSTSGAALPRAVDSSVSGSVVQVGDTVTVTAEATDPLGLSLEYQFSLFRHCGWAELLSNWTASSTVNYTFTTEDITTCTAIFVHVRNNDTREAEGPDRGDNQGQVSFAVGYHGGTTDGTPRNHINCYNSVPQVAAKAGTPSIIAWPVNWETSSIDNICTSVEIDRCSDPPDVGDDWFRQVALRRKINCTEAEAEGGIWEWWYFTWRAEVCVQLQNDAGVRNVTCCADQYCNSPMGGSPDVQVLNPPMTDTLDCYTSLDTGKPLSIGMPPAVYLATYSSWHNPDAYVYEPRVCVSSRTDLCQLYEYEGHELTRNCTAEEKVQGIWKWDYYSWPASTCYWAQQLTVTGDFDYMGTVSWQDLTCCTTSGCNRPKPDKDVTTQVVNLNPALTGTLDCFISLNSSASAAATVQSVRYNVSSATAVALYSVTGAAASSAQVLVESLWDPLSVDRGSDPFVCASYKYTGNQLCIDPTNCTEQQSDTNSSSLALEHTVFTYMPAGQCYKMQWLSQLNRSNILNATCCNTDNCNIPLEPEVQIVPSAYYDVRQSRCPNGTYISTLVVGSYVNWTISAWQPPALSAEATTAAVAQFLTIQVSMDPAWEQQQELRQHFTYWKSAMLPLHPAPSPPPPSYGIPLPLSVSQVQSGRCQVSSTSVQLFGGTVDLYVLAIINPGATVYVEVWGQAGAEVDSAITPGHVAPGGWFMTGVRYMSPKANL